MNTQTTTRNTVTPRHDDTVTQNLICSYKVDGTAVFDRDGEKLGTVRNLMIDRSSGQVANVIVGFGGLFGMGEDHYPMPWDALNYDPDKKGYVTKFDREMLSKDKAPHFARDRQPEWNAEYSRSIRSYYLPR